MEKAVVFYIIIVLHVDLLSYLYFEEEMEYPLIAEKSVNYQNICTNCISVEEYIVKIYAHKKSR